MKRRVLWLLLIASFSFSAQQKRKQESAIRIEVVEIKAAREAGKITLDGQIRNSGTRALDRLVLLFDLLDADLKTISRRRGPVELKVFGPGDEYTFNFYVPDHARAVEVRVAAEHRGQEMDVIKAGPYALE